MVTIEVGQIGDLAKRLEYLEAQVNEALRSDEVPLASQGDVVIRVHAPTGHDSFNQRFREFEGTYLGVARPIRHSYAPPEKVIFLAKGGRRIGEYLGIRRVDEGLYGTNGIDMNGLFEIETAGIVEVRVAGTLTEVTDQ